MIRWEAPEAHHAPHTSDWYIALWIIAISASAAAILFANVLLALIILLASFVATMHARKGPKMTHYEITRSGVRMDNILYPYRTLDAFSIDHPFGDHPHFPRLILKSKKTFMPLISATLSGVSEHDVRESLLDHLPEEELRESILHHFLEYLGL